MGLDEHPSRDLQGLVLAPYGRDAELLQAALAASGAAAILCDDLDDLLAQMRSGVADLLVLSDDAFVRRGDDRLLAGLQSRGANGDDILPLVLLTGSTELLHPLTRFPGVVVIAKPTRRPILDSVLRGALDTRRRVLALRTQREALEERNRMLETMTRDLDARNFELVDAMQSKDRFVATMSHELRTPLNAVLSYADLLDAEIGGPLNATQRDYNNRIIQSARHLLDLISEVLDFAKLNAGQIRVEGCPIDLQAVVDSAVILMAPRAEEKGLHLSVLAPSEPLPPVLGDHLRIRQVLFNLLSNSIKFTNRGHVTIRFCSEDSETVSVLVEDSGIGIGPNEVSHLFTDFFQVDPALNRRYDGSGLGLAISKRLALLMHGDLSAESELGRGSVFTLTLPRADC